MTTTNHFTLQVLAAAAKDPELNHILQLASQGRANVAQLRTLGSAIKAIEAGTYSGSVPPSVAPNASPTPVAPTSHVPPQGGQAPSASVAQSRPTPSAPVLTPSGSVSAAVSAPTHAPVSTSALSTIAPTHAPVPTPIPAPAPTATHASTTPAIPTTAVLLEFAERPIDRWLLPTEYVLLDRRENGDILLSTFYPFDAYVPPGGAMRSKPAHPITMRFAAASTGIWSALSRTCTTVSPSSVRSILAEVVSKSSRVRGVCIDLATQISNVPQRTYLQYRIVPGAMWEDIKVVRLIDRFSSLPIYLILSTTGQPHCAVFSTAVYHSNSYCHNRATTSRRRYRRWQYREKEKSRNWC
jgi:hypothetical protein